MSRERQRDRRKRRELSQGAELQEQQVQGRAAQPEQESPAATTVAHWQATFGNRFVAQALSGQAGPGLGALAADTLQLGIAGVDTQDMMPGTGSISVLRAMRDAGLGVQVGQPATPDLDQVGRRAGRPLPRAVRTRMERVFGHDFGHVRIHTDPSAARTAADLQARAFAVESEIFFGSGEWQPDSPQGQQLLAHELAHVVQADERRLPTPSGPGVQVSSPADQAEVQAEAVARKVVGELGREAQAPGTELGPAEGDHADASEQTPSTNAAAEAPIMRRARGGRRSQRRSASQRRRGSPQRQQPRPQRRRQPQAEPAEEQRARREQSTSRASSSDLLAEALATTIASIVVDPEEEQEQEQQRGGEAASQQARGGPSRGGPAQRPAGGAPAGGRPGQQPEDAEGEQEQLPLTPEERLQRFTEGEQEEPAASDAGLAPEHLREALGSFLPAERQRLRQRAEDPQGNPEADELAELVPRAVRRAAPLLDALRAEAGEEGVERPQGPLPEADAADASAGEPAVEESQERDPTQPADTQVTTSTPESGAAAPPADTSATGPAPAEEAQELADEASEADEALEEAEEELEEAEAEASSEEEEQESEESDGVPTGQGRCSSTAEYNAERDRLQGEINYVEIDIEWNEADLAATGGLMEGEQEDISGVQEEMDENTERRDARKELVDQRNERAQANNKPPVPAEKDSELRFRGLKAKRYPVEMKSLEKGVKKLKTETDRLNEINAALQEKLQALQDELNALQPPSGGGATGPENVPRICEKLSEQITRKKTETQRTLDTATRERDELADRIETLTTTLEDLDDDYQDAIDRWRDTQDDLDAADADLADQQSTLSSSSDSSAGQSVPAAAAGDQVCQSTQGERDGLQALLDDLESEWRTEIPARRRTAEGQKAEAETQHREKVTLVTDNEREIELMDLAVTTLEGGTLLYQQIAGRFGLHARIFHYPPGHRPWSPDDEFRTPEQMEAERQLFAAQQEEQEENTETDSEIGPVSLDDATQADRTAAGESSTDPNADNAAERRAAREAAEQRERDALQRDISAARNLPPEERARRLEQLGAGQSPRKTPAQLAAMFDQQVSDTASAIASQNITAPIPTDATELARVAESSGVSVEALQRWSEEQVRVDTRARAARYLGLPPEQGQEAADRLATLGAEQGMNGTEMLDHLVHLPPGSFPEGSEMANLQAQVQEAADNDPDLGSSRPNGMSLAAWREQQRTEATSRQSTINDTRAIAESMGVSFNEVDGYVASLAGATNMTPDEIRDQLKQGGPAEGQGQTMSAGDINTRLQEIQRTEDPARRRELLGTLAGQIPPGQLMGAMLARGEDGNGLVEGPVANQQLDSRLDAISSMPMQQQWEAYANLSRMTGMSPDSLMRAQRNRDTRDQALTGVSDIRSDGDLSPGERERRMAELAERTNLTIEQLNAAYEQSILATQAALASAAGMDLPMGPRQAGAPLTDNLFEGVPDSELTPLQRTMRDLRQGNLSEQDAEIALNRVAAATGIDPNDLRRYTRVATLENNQARWGERLGMEGPEAARQLTTWAEQRGITPDEMMNHLRRLPPDQCPPEMQAAQAALARWDTENAGEDEHARDVDELARMRHEAGLSGNQSFDRIITDPHEISQITDPDARARAQRRYDRYIEVRDAFILELDETGVEDDEALDRLRDMTPAQRAALMADPAAVDEDGQTMRESFTDGCDGNPEQRRGLALLNQADAYNRALASGLQEATREATRDAIDLEARAQQTMAVTRMLGTRDAQGNNTPIPFDEANARIDALVQANGWSREQAVQELRDAPDPQALIAPLFTVETERITRANGTQVTRTRPSPAMRAELNRVNALPPDQRRAGLLRLQSISGLSDDQMHAAQGELTVENHVVQALHRARELPEAERQRVMERLQEETGRSVTELQGMADRVQAQDRAALSRSPQAEAHITRLRDCAIGDLQSNAEEVARQTGMPVDVVMRLAQADRSQQPGHSIESFVGQDAATQETFRNEAYRRNMSVEEFADYLARSPTNQLPFALRSLQSSVQASGYKAQYTETEQEARLNALGNPLDPAYITARNTLFNQLTHDCTDEVIMRTLNGMTPAQRRLFFEEWEQRRLAGGTIGGGDDHEEMQPIEDQLRDALQGGDEDRGIELLRASRSFDPEAALQLDVREPEFTGLRNSLLREIQPPGRPDPDTVRQYFGQMTPSQRAQFLRDQEALITAATEEMHQGRRNRNEIPVRIDTLMSGDDAYQVMLHDAQSIRDQDARGGPASSTAAAERTDEVETRVRETDRAIDALNWEGDRHQAYTLLQSMARDNELSNENMLRLLEDRELVDDTSETPEYVTRMMRTAPSQRRRERRGESSADTRTAAERAAQGRAAQGQTLAGYSMDAAQVTSHAETIQGFLDGNRRVSSRQITELLQGCNPRELSELDRRLQPGGLASLTQVRYDDRGYMLPRVFGPAAIEVASMTRRAEDYRLVEREDALVLELSANDPRGQVDPSTPDGLAQRMAWARGLPPEQRIAELNRLRGQIRANTEDMGATIAQAYLGGSLSGSAQVMRPALLAQVEAARNLPPSQRDAQLALLARLSGHSEVRDLQRAANVSRANLAAVTEFQRVDGLPEHERLAEISRICESSGMSESQLRLLLDQCQDSGVLDRPVQELSEEAEQELDRIKDIRDPDERREALEALARSTGLTAADMIAHLNQKSREAREEGQLRVNAERQASEIADKIRAGDEDDIRAIMDRYGNDPENFQRILREYPGGVDALRRALRSEFGATDTDNLDFLDMIDRAEDYEPPPDLPPGIDAEVSLQLQDILRRYPVSDDPEEQTRREAALAEFKLMNSLSESDFTSVQAHAEHMNEVFDADVERRQVLIAAEVNSMWVDDDRMRELIMDCDPAMLAALQQRYPDLMKDALEGTGGDVYEDIDHKLSMANEVMELPYEERADRIREIRVDYKVEQLTEEFNAVFWRDPARVLELLDDCSEEELKLLDERFGGRLAEKIDEVMKPTIFQTIAVVAVFVVCGGIAGVLVANAVAANDSDTGLQSIRGKVNATRTDGEGNYSLDETKVNDSAQRLQDELNSTLWVSDAALLATLTSLNPRELMELQARMQGDGPDALNITDSDGNRLSLHDLVQKHLGGDEKAKAVALLADADDAMSGRDRRSELKDSCRDMAIKEKMDELAKNPRNKDKSAAELYKLAVADERALAAKTQEKIKKIRDGANSMFKAIDGWGDAEKDVLKTLAGLTPDEIELMKVEYRRHFGKDLETQMREDMGLGDWKPEDGFEPGGFWTAHFTDKNEGRIALMMMSREHRVEGVKEMLLEYSDRGWCEDEDLIFNTLENMTVEERTKLVTGPDSAQFLMLLKRDLGTNELEMVNALTAINEKTGKAEANKAHVAAVKMKMAIHGSGDWWDFSSWGTEESDFLSELDKLTPEEVKQAMAYYNANLSSGGSFMEEMSGDFAPGSPEWKVIEAEMRGDKLSADVWRIEYAAAGWGTDEKLLEETFAAAKEGRGGRSKDHLARLQGAFNMTFGQEGDKYSDRRGTGQDALSVMLGEETQGLERVYFTQMAEKGEADDEITLLYAMEGWGTDEEKVKKVLKKVGKLSPAQRDAFAQRFASMAGDLLGSSQSLEEWVDGDFSGTEGFELKLLLMGEPKTPQDFLERARMRYDFERSGAGNVLGNLFMDGLEAMGAHSNSSLLIGHQADIEAMFGPDGKLLDPMAFDELKELSEWQEQDSKNYREVRDKATDYVVTAIQAIGAIVCMIIPGGQAFSAAWIAYLVKFAASMAVTAVTMAMKAGLKGGGYGWEDAGIDLAQGVLEAATAGLGGMREFQKAAAGAMAAAKGLVVEGAKKTFKEVAKEALEEAVTGAAESLLSAVITSEQVWEGGGEGELFKHLLKETAMGGLKKGAMSFVGEGMKKMPWGKKLEEIEALAKKAGTQPPFLLQYGLKYVNEVATGAVSTALDHNKWQAWAKGEGVDGHLLKSLFIDPAWKGLLKAGINRSDFKRRLEASMELSKAENDLTTYQRMLESGESEHDPQVLRNLIERAESTIDEKRSAISRIDGEVAEDIEEAARAKIREAQEVESQLRSKDIDEDEIESRSQHVAMRQEVEGAAEAVEEQAATLKKRADQGGPDLDAETDAETGTVRSKSRAEIEQEIEAEGTQPRRKADQGPEQEEDSDTVQARRAIDQDIEEAEGLDQWRSFGNFKELADDKGNILGAKVLGDDGEFDPAFKAKLQKLGYVVRKNNVIARSDTGDQVPLHIEDGRVVAGLSVSGRSKTPTHLANELLPGGSRGELWQTARAMVDQEITLADGTVVKVTRVVPAVVHTGVDSEGQALTGRRIALTTADGQIIYHSIDDFQDAATGPRGSPRPQSDDGPDPAPVVRALAEGDTSALTGGDPAAATQVFASPQVRKAVDQAFEDAPDAPAQRQRQVNNLLDSFGGDFMAAHEAFGHGDSRAVQKALNQHRGQLVGSLISEVQDAFPGLKVTAKRLDPDSPTLSFEFAGGETAHARAFLEQAARELYGGSLKSTLGVELSAAPVRLSADADADTDSSRRVQGSFTDPISYEEDGVTRYFSDGKGGKWGYSTKFGFESELAGDGSFVIRQKVVLVADDIDDPDVQRVKADVEAANATYYNDPKHRIVVDDVERPLRQELDVEIITKAEATKRADARAKAKADAAAAGEDYDPGVEPTTINVEKGKGRASSDTLYTEGPDTPADDKYRQMVIAHELAHAIWGLADRYEDGAQQVKNPNYDPAVDPPEKEFVQIRSEARKDSNAQHVSHEQGLMEDFNVAYIEGKQTLDVGKSWEDLAQQNWKGLQTIYEESNKAMPVKPDGSTDWAQALKEINPSLANKSGAYPMSLDAGVEVMLPKLTAPEGWGVSAGNLKQLEWHVAQARHGQVDFELGDGSVADQVVAAEKAKAFAKPQQAYSKAAVIKAKEHGFDLDGLSPSAIAADRGRGKVGKKASAAISAADAGTGAKADAEHATAGGKTTTKLAPMAAAADEDESTATATPAARPAVAPDDDDDTWSDTPNYNKVQKAGIFGVEIAADGAIPAETQQALRELGYSVASDKTIRRKAGSGDEMVPLHVEDGRIVPGLRSARKTLADRVDELIDGGTSGETWNKAKALEGQKIAIGDESVEVAAVVPVQVTALKNAQGDALTLAEALGQEKYTRLNQLVRLALRGTPDGTTVIDGDEAAAGAAAGKRNKLGDGETNKEPVEVAGRKMAVEDVEELLQRLAKHEINLVEGTTLLRAFGYRDQVEDAGGGAIHHVIPLYMGGDHTRSNLLEMPEDTVSIGGRRSKAKHRAGKLEHGDVDVHKALHKLFNELRTTLDDIAASPGGLRSAARAQGDTETKLALITKDGRIVYHNPDALPEPLSESAAPRHAAQAPDLEPQATTAAPTRRSEDDDEGPPDLSVRPGSPDAGAAEPAPQVGLSEPKGREGREKIRGTDLYDTEDGVQKAARAARRDEDVTFNFPDGMPEADRKAFVGAVMARLGVEVDDPEFEEFTNFGDKKITLQAKTKQLEDVLWDGAEGGVARDLQGSTHRFTALMHIVESGDMGKLKLSDVAGAQGETVGQLYELWRSGKIGAQNAPDCFEPAKAREIVDSIRKNGYITDESQAGDLIDPAARGEIHGINVLPEADSYQDVAIDHKVRGWQEFVLDGKAAMGRDEWEARKASDVGGPSSLAPQAPDMALPPRAPGPEAYEHEPAPTRIREVLSDDDAQALAARDPAAALAVFEDPGKRRAIDQGIAAQDSHEQRLKLAGELLDSFGGDFAAAYTTFARGGNHAVVDALDQQRNLAVRALISDAEDLFPGLSIKTSHLDIDKPDLTLSFSGPAAEAARAYLETSASISLDGSLAESLGIRFEGGPTRAAPAVQEPAEEPDLDRARRGRDPTPAQIADFQEKNLNYDTYVRDTDRLLAERPELRALVAEHGLTHEEAVAMYAYSRNDYSDINMVLRGEAPDLAGDFGGQIAVTSSALEKLPDFRGVVFRRCKDGEWTDVYQPGATVTERAYTSTSMEYDTQLGAPGAGRVEFVIGSRTGKDITQLSGKGELENEVLFKPGVEFKVRKRFVEDDGTVVIEMDELRADERRGAQTPDMAPAPFMAPGAPAPAAPEVPPATARRSPQDELSHLQQQKRRVTADLDGGSDDSWRSLVDQDTDQVRLIAPGELTRLLAHERVISLGAMQAMTDPDKAVSKHGAMIDYLRSVYNCRKSEGEFRPTRDDDGQLQVKQNIQPQMRDNPVFPTSAFGPSTHGYADELLAGDRFMIRLKPEAYARLNATPNKSIVESEYCIANQYSIDDIDYIADVANNRYLYTSDGGYSEEGEQRRSQAKASVSDDEYAQYKAVGDIIDDLGRLNGASPEDFEVGIQDLRSRVDTLREEGAPPVPRPGGDRDDALELAADAAVAMARPPGRPPAPPAPDGGGVAPPAPAPKRAKTLDLDEADQGALLKAGLSKKEARRIRALREQNDGVFDFKLFASLNADHDVAVLAKAAKLSGREQEAVKAVLKAGESEAEAAQRIGLDPRPFGTRVEVEGVAELHNHFKGILKAEDFPALVFPDLEHQPELAATKTLELLRDSFNDPDPEAEHNEPHKQPATDLIRAMLNDPAADADPMAALHRVMTASNEMPFDFTYDARGVLIDKVKGDGRAEQFVRDTLLELRAQGVTYAELQGKISTAGMSQEDFADLGDELGVKVRMLPQLLTHQFAEGGQGFEDDKLRALLFGPGHRPGDKVPDMVGGVDICGPEAGRWNEQGMDFMEQAFKILQSEAELSGRRLVLRPHVGEGYSGTEAQRRLGVEGDARQGEVAQQNLGLLLTRLEQMKDAGTYEPPPAGAVEIRLGHVTQATEEQIRLMADLGVIAEVNIGSNLVTGALGRPGDPGGTRLDEHPLLTLLYHDVKTVLSTDAQGVMSTDISKEYGFASDILARFVNGETGITVPDPDDPTGKSRKILRWGELSEEQQARFEVAHLASMAQDEASKGRAPMRRPADEDAGPSSPPRSPGGGHEASPGAAGPSGPELDAEQDLPESKLKKGWIAKIWDQLSGAFRWAKQAVSLSSQRDREPSKAGASPDNASTGPDRTAPEPGRPVTQPKQGETPLIGLHTNFFDPESSADELTAQLSQQGVPRQQRLSPEEREAESAFAGWVQANPRLAKERALLLAQGIGNADQPIFEVDAMKRLMPDYGPDSKPADEAERKFRLEQNHALHPSAVAVARLAFTARLDELAALPDEDPRKQILITNGGCGAGKSVLTQAVKDGMGDEATFGAVWDAAGEGDALENAWILKAAQARGLKVVVGYAEADPITRYKGVLERAASKGRVVDVLTFINSYCDGATEVRRFMESEEYQRAVAEDQAVAFGVAPGEVNRAAFTDKSQKIFPDMRQLNPDGPMEAQHLGAAPDKQAALEASLQILEDYVEDERAAGRDPTIVARGALENALKFLDDQPPEIQEAILESYRRIFGRSPS